MSTILNGAVSAHLNKSTNQHKTECNTSDFIGSCTADCSPLGYVIQSLATNGVDDPAKVSDSLVIANWQINSLLKVVTQCICREGEYSLTRGLHCDQEDVLNSLDLVSQLIDISNDAHEKLNRVMRGEAL